MWYRANHFCAHTAPVDASRNCVYATEGPKIPLLVYSHDAEVVVPWLCGIA